MVTDYDKTRKLNLGLHGNMLRMITPLLRNEPILLDPGPSFLIRGATSAGKRHISHVIAAELGMHFYEVIIIECYISLSQNAVDRLL